jgi:RHS repeat-associated protein
VAVTKYVYDGDVVLQETDGSGVTLTEYTSTGQGYGDLLSAYDGSAARYYEPDALGSTDALADQSQMVVDRWRYRAFGSAMQTTGVDSTPFTWVGRLGYYSDSETGLYQLGNGTRYYDPQTAQFLSPDPIGFAGGDSNLRRYGSNRSSIASDPSGLRPDYGREFLPLLRFENSLSLLPSPLAVLVQSMTCPLSEFEERVLREILTDDQEIFRNPAPLTRLAIAAKLQQCYGYLPPPIIDIYLPRFCDVLVKIGKSRIAALASNDYRQRERAGKMLLEYILVLLQGCGYAACELVYALENLTDAEAIDRVRQLIEQKPDVWDQSQPYRRGCVEAKTRIGLGCLGGGGVISKFS